MKYIELIKEGTFMKLIAIILTLISLSTILIIQVGGPMAQPSDSIKRSIPPVDKEIPAKIETATFGLG